MSTPAPVRVVRPKSLLFVFTTSAAAAGLLTAISHWTGSPWILPPLGATTYICFVKPTLPPASPRNVLLGHIVGILCGIAALAACGILNQPTDVPLQMEWPRVMACALALGLTSTGMFALRIEHPPSGATTLIIAFGVCPVSFGLVTYVGGIAILLLLTSAVHRLRGIDYPIWRARETLTIGAAT